MSDLSNFAENKVVDALFRGIAYAPANVYVALFTAAPNDAGGGTEVSGGAYARQQVACNTTNWAGTQGPGTTVASSGTNGTTSNNIQITFPVATANWGTITHAQLFDAATGGNPLSRMTVTSPVTINSGSPALSFAPAALTFQIDN